jgi:hypothetical protein
MTLVRCRTCGRDLPAFRVVTAGEAAICDHCIADYPRRLDALLNEQWRCTECRRHIKDLPDDGAGNVFMRIHIKDGVYQMLCEDCSRQYAMRRRDIYGGTEFLKKIEQGR